MPTDMFEQICRGLKVLVVDDKSVSRDLIKKILIEEGLIVVGEARDGDEALSLFEALKPDLVTMDINMPNVNGLRAIKKIMKVDAKANIIVVSGYQNSENKAREFGAKDFLAKPFQPAFLINKIRKLVEDGAFNQVFEPEEESIIDITNNAEEDTSEIETEQMTQGVEKTVQSIEKESSADEILSSEENSKQDKSDSESKSIILADDDGDDDLLSSIDFETGEGFELLSIKEDEVLVINDEDDDAEDDMLISLPSHRSEIKRETIFVSPEEDMVIETILDEPEVETEHENHEVDTVDDSKTHKESRRSDIIVRPPRMNVESVEESSEVEDLIIDPDGENGLNTKDKSKKKSKNKENTKKKNLFGFFKKK